MQIPELPIDPEGMETTKHGSFAFPLAVYHSVMSKNVLGHTPWHWHRELQFCLVTRGQICFHVNEKQYPLPAGEGVFIGSGYLHMARPAGAPDSAYICLNADARLIASFPGSVFEERYVRPFLQDPALEDCRLSPAVPWQREVLDHVALACDLFEQRRFGYELRLAGLLQEMWLLLLENRPASAPAAHSRQQENAVVQGILTCISRRFSQRITLDDIARSVAFSGSECCRIFKKVTGNTIFSYLRSYRLARGMELLQNTQLPISQIAYDTGFCSASYFTEVFRTQVGMTPLRYRQGARRAPEDGAYTPPPSPPGSPG